MHDLDRFADLVEHAEQHEDEADMLRSQGRATTATLSREMAATKWAFAEKVWGRIMGTDERPADAEIDRALPPEPVVLPAGLAPPLVVRHEPDGIKAVRLRAWGNS